MKKKTGLIGLLSLFIVSLPSVLAQGMLDRVWGRIIGIGNLSFLGISDGSLVAGFVRILVGILVFALFFALFKNLKQVDFLEKQATIISLILAIITAVFMPASVLLGIGSGWGIFVAFVLVGAPLVGIVYLLWKIPWEGKETRFSVFIKLMLCLLLFWILSAMKYHVGMMAQ